MENWRQWIKEEKIITLEPAMGIANKRKHSFKCPTHEERGAIYGPGVYHYSDARNVTDIVSSPFEVLWTNTERKEAMNDDILEESNWGFANE